MEEREIQKEEMERGDEKMGRLQKEERDRQLEEEIERQQLEKRDKQQALHYEKGIE